MNKKLKKEIKKKIKKTPTSILICLIIFFIIGLPVGYFGIQQLTKDDTFEIIGDKNITLKVNEEYVEPGANAIQFGKDMKENIQIESNVDTTTEGEYTVIYTVKSSFKYKNIKRVRYVTVTNGSDNNE